MTKELKAAMDLCTNMVPQEKEKRKKDVRCQTFFQQKKYLKIHIQQQVCSKNKKKMLCSKCLKIFKSRTGLA